MAMSICGHIIVTRDKILKYELPIECYMSSFTFKKGKRWRSWLRHCATSRKVAGSTPDSVIGILHRLNPSGRTVALGSTQSLREMSTR